MLKISNMTAPLQGSLYERVKKVPIMNYTLLMELVSRIGCGIAMGGAETYRVEESVNRILGAYGVESRVYSVPNSLIITIIIPDQPPMTQLCRMERKGNDLDAVEQYSNLGRRICTQKPELETVMQWLEDTEKARKKYSFPVVLAGYVLVAWGFSIFFGGSLMDSLCAAACGLLLGIAEHFMGKLHANVFFQKIAAAFLMAALAYHKGLCSNTRKRVHKEGLGSHRQIQAGQMKIRCLLYHVSKGGNIVYCARVKLRIGKQIDLVFRMADNIACSVFFCKILRAYRKRMSAFRDRHRRPFMIAKRVVLAEHEYIQMVNSGLIFCICGQSLCPSAREVDDYTPVRAWHKRFLHPLTARGQQHQRHAKEYVNCSSQFILPVLLSTH